MHYSFLSEGLLRVKSINKFFYTYQFIIIEEHLVKQTTTTTNTVYKEMYG